MVNFPRFTQLAILLTLIYVSQAHPTSPKKEDGEKQSKAASPSKSMFRMPTIPGLTKSPPKQTTTTATDDKKVPEGDKKTGTPLISEGEDLKDSGEGSSTGGLLRRMTDQLTLDRVSNVADLGYKVAIKAPLPTPIAAVLSASRIPLKTAAEICRTGDLSLASETAYQSLIESANDVIRTVPGVQAIHSTAKGIHDIYQGEKITDVIAKRTQEIAEAHIPGYIYAKASYSMFTELWESEDVKKTLKEKGVEAARQQLLQKYPDWKDAINLGMRIAQDEKLGDNVKRALTEHGQELIKDKITEMYTDLPLEAIDIGLRVEKDVEKGSTYEKAVEKEAKNISTENLLMKNPSIRTYIESASRGNSRVPSRNVSMTSLAASIEKAGKGKDKAEEPAKPDEKRRAPSGKLISGVANAWRSASGKFKKKDTQGTKDAKK